MLETLTEDVELGTEETDALPEEELLTVLDSLTVEETVPEVETV